MNCPHCHSDAAVGKHGAGGACERGTPSMAAVYRVANALRRCSRCGESKPATAEYFPKLSGARAGNLSSWCRACCNQATRERSSGKKEPLKRLACVFAHAKVGSDLETRTRAELIEAILATPKARTA